MTLSKSKILNSPLNLHTSNNSNSNLNSSNIQECADCSSTNVNWASLNHGVVLCDSCCLAHRSLGRCISIIKSLKKSYWPQSLIDTLYELVRSNSNQIWESILHTPEIKQLNLKNIKKPTQKDSNTTKLNYIKMKYENLAFISRGKYSSIEELNQQLMSSVKTNNYEQTLRILSQGADSNYRSQEDGNQCLHTAVLNNQLGQIELLCLYGADLTGLDRNGQTAYELAKSLDNQQIADRLLELQFELTDEFSYFLANKRPDHKNGKHFLIPDSTNDQNLADNQNKKLNLEELQDHLFEELAKDIYDELDRRQIETIWKSTVGPGLVNEPIPFLIIKSCFTQTRNQLRQKLARFNTQEFSNLLVEILNEFQRRYNQSENFDKISKREDEELENGEEKLLEEDEDEDLYDKVPSDEDYASVASESSSTVQLNSNEKNSNHDEEPKKQLKLDSPIKLDTVIKNNLCSPTISIKSSSSSSNRSNKNTPSPGIKILNTKFDKAPNHTNKNQSALVANAESALNSIINSLNQIDLTPNLAHNTSNTPTKSNINYSELKNENQLMQSMIERLMEENAQLRAENMLLLTNQAQPGKNNTNIAQNISNYYSNEELTLYSSVKSKNCLNKNLIQTSNGQTNELFNNKLFNNQNKKIQGDYDLCNIQDACFEKNFKFDQIFESLQLFDSITNKTNVESYAFSSSSNNSSPSKPKQSQIKSSSFRHDITYQSSLSTSPLNLSQSTKSQTKASPSRSLLINSPRSQQSEQQNIALPSKDVVIKKMKKITKSVQELFKATKQAQFSILKNLCDKVNQSVSEMIVLFPSNLSSSDIQENLSLLEQTSNLLLNLSNKYETKLEYFSLNEETNNSAQELTQEDMNLKNTIVSDLVSFSYEIAHTVKRIVCIMGADN